MEATALSNAFVFRSGSRASVLQVLTSILQHLKAMLSYTPCRSSVANVPENKKDPDGPWNHKQGLLPKMGATLDVKATGVNEPRS